ncbi:MAG TPA: lipid-A-disaccharide synthase N-terminal domain-containing protein, partial [Xanthobacteraceae bacterium]
MQSLIRYFHEVFVLQFDAWVAIGFLAQALFSARFLVQWIASERAGRSVLP